MFDVESLKSELIETEGTDIVELHEYGTQYLLYLQRKGSLQSFDISKSQLIVDLSFGEQCSLLSPDFEYPHGCLSADGCFFAVGGYNPYQHYFHLKLINMKKAKMVSTKYIGLQGAKCKG